MYVCTWVRRLIYRDNPELPLDASGVCLYLLVECGEWRVDWRSYVTICRHQRYTADIAHNTPHQSSQ
ncbi:hypothetical protein J6590_081758 [Homalodisca vitripennis]|nr:hypothetical protein J6590_081758 [Homalodisca vitripennis]